MKKILCTRTELEAFGKNGEIEIFYPDRTSFGVLARVVLDLAVRETQRLDSLLCAKKPGSEIEQLNDEAGKEYIRVSRETMHLLYKAKKNSLAANDEQAQAFSHLYLMPQGRFGYGYDEDIAEDPYGGYIGGIAIIATEDTAVNIDGAAAAYAVGQIADILREYGVRNARIRIGDAEISSGQYAEIFEKQGMQRRPVIGGYGVAGA